MHGHIPKGVLSLLECVCVCVCLFVFIVNLGRTRLQTPFALCLTIQCAINFFT